MQHRNKKFIEDIIIIGLAFGVVIGVYVAFFSGESNENTTSNTMTTKEVKKEENNQTQKLIPEKQITEDEIVKTIVEDDKEKEKEILAKIEASIKENLEKEENLSQEQIIKPEIKIDEVDMSMQDFQIQLLAKIKEAAEPKRIKHNFFRENRGYVKASFLVSKEGNLDNLEYQKGDEFYLTYIKTEILSLFPINIPKNLENDFPQSFELRIEY